MSALASVDPADYPTLRETMGVSYRLLSKHASILEDAGHPGIRKTFDGRTPTTHIRITRTGRAAFDLRLSAPGTIVRGLT